MYGWKFRLSFKIGWYPVHDLKEVGILWFSVVISNLVILRYEDCLNMHFTTAPESCDLHSIYFSGVCRCVHSKFTVCIFLMNTDSKHKEMQDEVRLITQKNLFDLSSFIGVHTYLLSTFSFDEWRSEYTT